MKQVFSYFCLIIILNSCQLFEGKDDREVVARVDEHLLYKEDVSDLIIEGDSIGTELLVKNYIENWVKKELLLKKALQNLSENQADFQAQLDDYKNSLLIYAYENLLVKQKLDTAVRKKELVKYYRANENNFKLKEQLIKGKFIQLINSAPMQDSLKFWLFSNEEDFDQKISEYCTQFAINCHLDTSEWVPFSMIREFLPASFPLEDLEITPGKNIISDTLQTLVIKMEEQRFPGELAPLPYVSNQIKNIIRNKRKLQLLNKAKEEIFEEATLKKKYEIYN